jgi:hypothetical protein
LAEERRLKRRRKRAPTHILEGLEVGEEIVVCSDV